MFGNKGLSEHGIKLSVEWQIDLHQFNARCLLSLLHQRPWRHNLEIWINKDQCFGSDLRWNITNMVSYIYLRLAFKYMLALINARDILFVHQHRSQSSSRLTWGMKKVWKHDLPWGQHRLQSSSRLTPRTCKKTGNTIINENSFLLLCIYKGLWYTLN